MRTFFKFLALTLAVLWLPLTQHCLLEAADCAPDSHEQHHAEACSPGCESDSCHVVETASYSAVSGRAHLTTPSEVWVGTLLAWLGVAPVFEEEPMVSTVETPETEALKRTWQFTARTALLPGAPARLV